MLARRTRALFLNARAAIRMAPAVATLVAKELRKGDEWQRKQVAAFTALARPVLSHVSGFRTGKTFDWVHWPHGGFTLLMSTALRFPTHVAEVPFRNP